MPSSFQPDQAPFEDRETSSSDSTSSSGGSSPILPLPDEVLRSFQFPDRQRVDATSGNAVEADRRGSGSSVQPSVNADEYRDAAANANDEDRTQSQYRNDLSEYDIPDLRLINAHYKALVLDHREQIIREIEANCEELGLDVRQQDWAALLKNLTATRPPTPRQGITANQTDLSHDEIQKQANPPQDIDPIPISEDQVAHESDTTLINGSPANSSSDTPAEPETPFRPLRALRGRKRAHSRLEQQSTDTADDREDEEAGEVVVRPRSPDRSQSLHSSDGGNEPGHESNSAMFVVNGIATRTAWSVVLDRYPDEVARVFRAGERPRNRQVESMLDLPAINTLVDNPMRRKHCLPWGIQNRRIDHLLAVLIQITGVAEIEPCEKCEKGSGLWKGCYTKPSAARLERNTKVCANCMMHGKSAKCRWKQGPALP